ncbi:MAG: HupE/UreJ family protein [Reyranellales bacterium]
MLRTISLMVLLLGVAGPALAHPGHDASGFLHPFTGYDHLLAMIGAGMWAALLAVRRPAAAFFVPAAFMAMMAVGAAAGFAGIKLPLAEAGVLASVFMLGGLVMAAVRVPVASAMVVVGMFAALHGYAHAVDAPVIDPGRYILGFLAATALLHAAGLGLGWVAQRLVGDLGLRAMGALLLAGGTLVLVGH